MFPTCSEHLATHVAPPGSLVEEMGLHIKSSGLEIFLSGFVLGLCHQEKDNAWFPGGVQGCTNLMIPPTFLGGFVFKQAKLPSPKHPWPGFLRFLHLV